MGMTIEKTILSNLINNEQFCRKVVPFLKKEYFLDPYENVIADELLSFFDKYNKPASINALAIQLPSHKGVSTSDIAPLETYINDLNFSTDNDDWLLEHTEKFCKERALQNAILDAFDIIEGKDKIQTKDAIPDILSKALGVSFDSSVGHNYFDDYADRYEFYHAADERIPFDIDIFNSITRGGLPKKTLTIALAGCVHPDTKIKIRLRKRPPAQPV